MFGQGLGNANDQPIKGLVWDEPDDLQHAVRELVYFAESGVEAVRVPILRDTTLLAVGDSLGIQFFQELPFKYAPAGVLLDSLESALLILDRALIAARTHQSARHFGLASSSDTSERSVCSYFETLSARVAQRLPGAQTYYVTHFLEDDACGLSVAFVLLDRYATDRVALSSEPNRFGKGRARGYGVAELGRRVDVREQVGLKQPYSAESQARYLENSLPVLLEKREGIENVVAVFVYRWGGGGDAGLRSGQGYALTSESGEKQPAWNVVQGFFTGDQTVFAFPAGSSLPDEMPWLPLFGLIIVASVAISYAVSPQFRQLVPRYFLSHGFYREAAAQGRDVTPVVNGILLGCVSLSVGVTAAVVFYTVRNLQVVQIVLFWLPDAVSQALLTLADRPWMLAILSSCCVALATLVWVSFLSLGSRLGRSLVPAQTLMIALWPHWLVLVILPVALVVPTFSQPVSLVLVQLLAFVALGIFVWILVRVTMDYAAACRGPVWLVALVALANPTVLLLGFVFLFVLPRFEYIRFLIHLVTRN